LQSAHDALLEPNSFADLPCGEDLIIKSTDSANLIVTEQLPNLLKNKLIMRLSGKQNRPIDFDSKSDFFSSFSNLLPTNYFEKAPIVRVVWELWASIRMYVSDLR